VNWSSSARLPHGIQIDHDARRTAPAYIERQLWTNNAELYHDHLVEDAMLIFGEIGPIDRDVAVDAIRQENADGPRWGKAKPHDVAVRTLVKDAALLCYRAGACWHSADADISVYASSVYVRRGDQWKLAFHQQTPLPTG
jgi:hypothetical protein